MLRLHYNDQVVMLLREIILIFCENFRKLRNAICGKTKCLMLKLVVHMVTILISNVEKNTLFCIFRNDIKIY